MKKFITFFLVFLCLCGSSFALSDGIDLTGMSYDELVALKDQINLAMWNSAEWQEVTVPQGVWKVGVDIPAGTWTIKCAPCEQDATFMRRCNIEWGSDLDDSGNIYWLTRKGSVAIYNSNSKYHEIGQITEYSITVKNGDYIQINTYYNMAVFTPYVGKPSFGFK